MKQRPAWFWIALAYLVATVAFNIWSQWFWFLHYPLVDMITVGTNLGCKMVAIVLLLYRRGAAAYLLAIAFVVGMGGTLWHVHLENQEFTYSTPVMISRVSGLVISFAIVLYMFDLKRRGLLNGQRNLDETLSHF
jgi:hypothetical protein